MPLTLSQIIEVSAPAMFNEMRLPYELSQVVSLPNDISYRCVIQDRITGRYASVGWDKDIEGRLLNESTRIMYAKELLLRAISALEPFRNDPPVGPLLEYRENTTGKVYPEPNVVDVDFS